MGINVGASLCAISLRSFETSNPRVLLLICSDSRRIAESSLGRCVKRLQPVQALLRRRTESPRFTQELSRGGTDQTRTEQDLLNRRSGLPRFKQCLLDAWSDETRLEHRLLDARLAEMRVEQQVLDTRADRSPITQVLLDPREIRQRSAHALLDTRSNRLSPLRFAQHRLSVHPTKTRRKTGRSRFFFGSQVPERQWLTQKM